MHALFIAGGSRLASYTYKPQLILIPLYKSLQDPSLFMHSYIIDINVDHYIICRLKYRITYVMVMYNIYMVLASYYVAIANMKLTNG